MTPKLDADLTSESSYPHSEVISVERRGHVAIVWLDRPDHRNAMSPGFRTEFPQVMDALSDDPDVRAIAIAAKGESFTVGLDLTAFGPAVMSGNIAVTGMPPRLSTRAM